jgi:nucleotide-binding universal stress UspA family protein
VIAALKNRGINARTEVAVGAAADEIIRFADEIQADIVAMSTHGRSGISRWAFGSTADKVLHAGNIPVLLVRAPVASTE